MAPTGKVAPVCGDCSSAADPARLFTCRGCPAPLCFACAIGIAIPATNKAVFDKIYKALTVDSKCARFHCKVCREAEENDDTISNSTVKDAKSGVISHQSDDLLNVVDKKLDSIRVCLETLSDKVAKTQTSASESAADSKVLVSHFGLKTYSAVLKGGLPSQTPATRIDPPTFAAQFPLLGSQTGVPPQGEDGTLHKKSLIIAGLPESQSDHEQSKSEDLAAVLSLMKDCRVEPEVVEVIRLGRNAPPGDARPRFLKVVLSSDTAVASVLSNKGNLRGKENWNGVSIRRSLTKTQQQEQRICFIRAAQLNGSKPARGEGDDVAYFVRRDDPLPRVLKKVNSRVQWSWHDNSEN